MTWREFWLVEKNVVLQGRREPLSAEIALNAATGKNGMLRGGVRNGRGVLRLRGLTYMAARSIRFRLTATNDGCELTGVLQPVLFLRIYRGAAAAMFLPFIVQMAIQMARGHASPSAAIGTVTVSFAVGVVFINGYTWLVVWFTRRIERILLKSIEYVLRDDQSAAVAAELLAS